MISYEELYAGERVCCTCIHYYQHYARKKGHYSAIYCGHCTFPRVKTRHPDQTCPHWRERKESPVSTG